MTLIWSLVFGALVLQISTVLGAPTGRAKRWLPPQMSDYDNGYDFQSASGGASPDGSMSHNNNYMSYWSDYFPGASGDYSGMSFRTNTADPVEQLKNVQAYSYAQMYQQQYPQLRFPYNYPPTPVMPYGYSSEPTYAGRAILGVNALNQAQQAQQNRQFAAMMTPGFFQFLQMVNAQQQQQQQTAGQVQNPNAATSGALLSVNSAQNTQDAANSDPQSNQQAANPALVDIKALDRSADEKAIVEDVQEADTAAENQAAQSEAVAVEDVQVEQAEAIADQGAEAESQQNTADIANVEDVQQEAAVEADSEPAANSGAQESQDAANEQARSYDITMDPNTMSDPVSSPLDQIYPGMMVPPAYRPPMMPYYQPPPPSQQSNGDQNSSQGSMPTSYPNYGMQYPNPYMSPYMSGYYGYPTPPRVARTTMPVVLKYVYGVPLYG